MTFDIDADGILSVSAVDQGTGQSQDVRVNPTGGLAPDQVEQLVADAEDHTEEDSRRKQDADLKNTADALLYSVRQMMEEYESTLAAEMMAELKEQAGCVEKALEADPDGLSSAVDDLQKLAFKATEAVYSEQGSAASDDFDEFIGDD